MAHVTLSVEKKRLLEQLPALLAGKVPDRYDIRRVFLSTFVWSLMKQIGDAFEEKSDGGFDDLGHHFRPLKNVTIKRKSSPSFRAKYPNTLPEQIMRASGKLLTSLSEGTFAGDAYIPPKHQVVKFSQGLLKIYTNLKYAEFQNARRPFWNSNIDQWIGHALQVGLDAVANRLGMVLR